MVVIGLRAAGRNESEATGGEGAAARQNLSIMLIAARAARRWRQSTRQPTRFYATSFCVAFYVEIRSIHSTKDLLPGCQLRFVTALNFVVTGPLLSNHCNLLEFLSSLSVTLVLMVGLLVAY